MITITIIFVKIIAVVSSTWLRFILSHYPLTRTTKGVPSTTQLSYPESKVDLGCAGSENILFVKVPAT